MMQIPPPGAEAASDSLQGERAAWRGAAGLWSLVFAGVLFAGVFVSGQPQAGAERVVPAGVREVVQLQLQALQSDDAGKAFALADPGVRTKFGNAEAFLEMVRDQYPMVHRPASVVFLPPEAEGGIAFQKVRLTDTSGSSWLVTYLLHRQQDDGWLISACLVVPDTPRVSA
jgi:hypothetical protein